MTDKLRGWDELADFVRVNRLTIIRWMKLYEFPEPTRESTGSARHCVWYKNDVMEWVANHPDLCTPIVENNYRRRVQKVQSIQRVRELMGNDDVVLIRGMIAGI